MDTNVRVVSSPGFLFNNPYFESVDLDLSEFADSLDSVSNMTTVGDSRISRSNSDWWEFSSDDSSVMFPKRRGSAMLSPPGQELNTTRIKPRRQLSSSTLDYSAAQVGSENQMALLDIDLELEFSIFESTSHEPSTARSALLAAEPISCISGEITCVSPLRLAQDNGTRSEDRTSSRVPRSRLPEGHALDRVTAQDIRAESITSLLMMLKSYVLPSFDIASQKYEYGKSIITKVFCPHFCEWLCS